MATSQDFVNWVCGPELNPAYLRYLLVLEQESVRRFASGTTHQTMYYPEAKALHALLPSRTWQDRAAAILSAFDDKISVNLRSIGLLAELLDARYLAALRDGSLTTPLDDLAEFHNRQRIPLSSREREARSGTIPYYGARAVRKVVWAGQRWGPGDGGWLLS
jgi:type I restriction enzyme S subunit